MTTRRRVLTGVLAAVAVAATAVTAVGLLAFDRYRPFTVAMQPTLHPGERIWARPGGPPRRGDVVLLVPPPRFAGSNFPQLKLVISRVLALGGDTVAARNGRLQVNGRRVHEPYLAHNTVTSDFAARVPAGRVFYLGDNRQNAADSRALGAIPASDVKAHVSWIGAPPMGLLVVFTMVVDGWLALILIRTRQSKNTEIRFTIR